MLLPGRLTSIVIGLGLMVPLGHADGRKVESTWLHADRVAASSTLVTVHVRHTVHVLPPTFFGINDVAFWGQGASPASARALKQTPIHTVRFPGGAPADWYDWQDPYYKGWSQTSPLQAWKLARSFGAQRMVFGTNYQGHLPNPPGRSYSVNSPQNAAAWVTYDRRLHIDGDMEVGNEEDLGMHQANDPAFVSYVHAFNAQARAMHRANPRVRVLGPVGANEYYWWGLNSLSTFLASAGNRTGSGQVDGISLHWYTGTSWSDSRNAAQSWLSSSGPWAAIQKMIHAHDSRALPVYITEWNIGTSQHNAFNPTVGHALVVADVVGAFALSGVAGQDYFGLRGASSWGLFYGTGESRPVDTPTSTYYALALWRHMGKRVLSTQVADGSTGLSTYATTGKGGSVQVLLINKQRTARTVTVQLNGTSAAGRRLSVYSLAGASGSVGDLNARYDGITMPSPQAALPGPRTLGTVHSRTVTYTLPGYSATVLALGAAPGALHSQFQPLVATRLSHAASIRFAVRLHVTHSSVADGKPQVLTVTATSNTDVKGAHVDLEVYDTLNNRVFRASGTVNFVADHSVRVVKRYVVSSRAGAGMYRVKVGIFDGHWKRMLFWKDNAGIFAVAGKPSPAITIRGSAAPSVRTAGGTEVVSAYVSTSYAGLSHTIIDIEVIGGGVEVCHSFKTGVDIPAGHMAQLVAACVIGPQRPTGMYTVKIGVFGHNWHPLYRWSDRAATFRVR